MLARTILPNFPLEACNICKTLRRDGRNDLEGSSLALFFLLHEFKTQQCLDEETARTQRPIREPLETGTLRILDVHCWYDGLERYKTTDISQRSGRLRRWTRRYIESWLSSHILLPCHFLTRHPPGPLLSTFRVVDAVAKKMGCYQSEIL